MLLTKLKIGTAVVLVAALLGVGTRFLPHPVQAAAPQVPAQEKRSQAEGERKEKTAAAALLVKKGTLEKVDVPRRAVSLTIPDTLANVHWNPGPGGAVRNAEGDAEAEIKVAQARLEQAKATLQKQDAVVALREAQADRCKALFANGAIDRKVLDASVKELATSMAEQEAAKAAVKECEAELVKANILARAKARRLRSTRLEGLPVSKDARITIRGKEGRLTDLKPGMRISIRLATEKDRLVIASIDAKD